MRYTWIRTNDDNTYSIMFDDPFYEIFYPYYEGNSYFNIMFRLYGLLPQDFFHYVGAQFNAYFKPSKYVPNTVNMYFKTKKDINAFAKDIDTRLSYLIKNKIQ